jgi:VanZ family protein
MLLIFWLSSHPSPEQTRWFPIIAKLKLIHIIEYAILFFFVRFALNNTTNYGWGEVFILALAITVLYGLTDEFHQIFVAGRTSKFEDVVADCVGGLIAGVFHGSRK